MLKSLKAEDVIIVVEIRQGWKNSERNLLWSYSCLLSNLHGPFSKLCRDWGSYCQSANEIEKEVLPQINSSRKDPRSNFVPLQAFHRFELKTFLIQKSTGRSFVLHDNARVGKYLAE